MAKAGFVTIIACTVVAVGGVVAMAGLAIRDAYRQERALQALSPADRAVIRHELPDGTVCYQPRDGWSRQLSCLRSTPERQP